MQQDAHGRLVLALTCSAISLFACSKMRVAQKYGYKYQVNELAFSRDGKLFYQGTGQGGWVGATGWRCLLQAAAAVPRLPGWPDACALPDHMACLLAGWVDFDENGRRSRVACPPVNRPHQL